MHQAEARCPEDQSEVDEYAGQDAEGDFGQPEVVDFAEGKFACIDQRQAVEDEHH